MSGVTLEQLIARKNQSEQDRLKVMEVESDELGGTIMAKKLPLEKFFDISDMSGETSEEAYRANCMLIYQSCDIFHDRELIEAYGCKEPYEVVTKIFHDNVCEVRTIADKIMKLYGYGKEKQGEKLKN